MMEDGWIAPLILTLRIDERAAAFFEGLRQEHFPPALNLVPAHVTLFRQLPGDLAEIAEDIRAEAEKRSPMRIEVSRVRNLGRGVAYQLESDDLLRLRNELAETWAERLTRQDQQSYKPHITVQNKVSPEVSKALFQTLQAGFSPFEITGVGLDLWRYLGGPWELYRSFRFDTGR